MQHQKSTPSCGIRCDGLVTYFVIYSQFFIISCCSKLFYLSWLSFHYIYIVL